MNFLKHTRAYLAGPIECGVGDAPVKWREDITPFLKKLNIVPVNPLNKPAWVPWYCQSGIIERQDLVDSGEITKEQADSTLDFDRKHCLQMVINSDFIIWCMNNNKTFGTTEELALATQLNKPIIAFRDEQIASTWMQSMTRDITVVDSFKDLMIHLKKLDREGILDPFGDIQADDFPTCSTFSPDSRTGCMAWTIPSYINYMENQ